MLLYDSTTYDKTVSNRLGRRVSKDTFMGRDLPYFLWGEGGGVK